MKVLLPGLSSVQLERVADALDRVPFDGDVEALVRRLPLSAQVASTDEGLRQSIAAWGVSTAATVLRAVASERRASIQTMDRRLELVWTGPERDGTATRDTAVAVRDLFLAARHDVLVAGYALFNARAIFEPLAQRMASTPTMRVRLVLNVGLDGPGSTADEALATFRRTFKSHHWPDAPMPAVYYDPRALSAGGTMRAVMHAKCVIVDGARCFLTSANLTEAAQVRNIELGVIINDSVWCSGVLTQFDDLIAQGALRQLSM